MPGSFGTSPSADGADVTTASSASNGISATNTATNAPPPGSAGGNGVFASSTVPYASGVVGASSISHGVHGINGKGASNPPLIAAGLWGESDGGFGVYGASIDNNGIHGDSTQSDAVVGVAHAQGKAGVLGISDAGNGVSGISASGIGLYGSGGTGVGVYGQSTSNWGVGGKSDTGAGVVGQSTSNNGIAGTSQTGSGVIGQSTGGVGVYGQSTSNWGMGGQSDTGAGVVGQSTSNNGIAGTSQTGNGVYGQSTSGYAGYFAGNCHVTGTHTVDTDIILTNGDCAEDFAVDPLADVGPGTVLVLDETGVLALSSSAYDRRVAGVVSGAGEFKPGIVLGRKPGSGQTATIALVGKTYCKADAEYGFIAVGDLLTTSPTRGHAMKAVDPAKAFGSVIGKALRPLQSGRGLIPILVALQ
jgi:hypothetical protein